MCTCCRAHRRTTRVTGPAPMDMTDATIEAELTQLLDTLAFHARTAGVTPAAERPDLQDTPIGEVAKMGRDFAWAPERFQYDRLPPDGLLQFVRFVDSAPVCDRKGKPLQLDALGRMRRAAAARAAILHLEGGDTEPAGDLFEGASFGQRFPGPVPVPQIAALAGLNARTVTNAIGRGELTATTPVDGEQAIDPVQLYPWIVSRPGFVAWPGSSAGKNRMAVRVRNASTRARYATLISEIAGWVPEAQLPDGWSDVQKGAFGPDAELLHAIAETLDLPDPAAIAAAGVCLALRESGAMEAVGDDLPTTA